LTKLYQASAKVPYVVIMNKIVSFLLIFFFISGSFAGAFSSVSAAELIENSWYEKTPSLNHAGACGLLLMEQFMLLAVL
jgi:hypothetical protein